MIDSAELNRKLIERYQELCFNLFPNGKVKGNQFLIGGLDGSEGESMHINLSGKLAGRFTDFANSEDKGTPLWLIAKARSASFPEAIRFAQDWLGIKEEDYGIHRHKQKTYSKPDKETVRPSEPNSPAMDYLTLQRKLDPAVIAKAKVGESQDGSEIIFQFADWDDETNRWLVAHRKYLKVDRLDGKKEIHASKGTKRCLYGKNLIDVNTSELVICEGEIDALSWHSWTIPAVSIPNGCTDFDWIDIDWDWLARFEKIYISTDMDPPGRKASEEICKRLGLHRCFIVELPLKDANECLVKGMKKEEMEKLLSTAKQIEMDEIKTPQSYADEVMEYYTTDWSKRGWDTPWYPKLPWRVRKSEFTVLSGYSGAGKALCIETPIPTPDGWKTMADIQIGDKVFDENGKQCNVTFITEVQHNRECFQVNFSDGSKITADADHRWETWSPHARNSYARKLIRNPILRAKGTRQDHKMIKPRIFNTKEIASSIYETRWKTGKHLRHAIPIAGPLDIQDKYLPLDPYCFGVWLGDGDTRWGAISVGRGDEETLGYFSVNGFKVVKNNIKDKTKCPHYGIHGLFRILTDLGVRGNKHIPRVYLRSSEKQRLALLQGLMDSDGYISEKGGCEFVTMLPHLAQQTKELILSLGIRCVITTGESTIYGKKCGTKYRILFTPSRQVFRLKRKASRLSGFTCLSRRSYRYITAVIPTGSVPVKCIQVDSPNNLYLCGESMIPTHNTVALNQLMLHLVNQGVKIMDISLEVKPGLTLYNMTRCAMAKKYSTKEEINGCVNWLNDSMWFLDCIGTVKIDRIMQAMEYARKRHGIDIFIIDSLFKCGLSSEDYGGQRDFADKLTTFCNNTGAHVILVAHSRKTQNGHELSIPSKSDVAGSSDLTNAAFNVIIWWRNKLKKRKLDECRQATIPNQEEYDKWVHEPDGKVVLDKQRFGEGEEAEVYLYFDPDSTQFQVTEDYRYPFFQHKVAS